MRPTPRPAPANHRQSPAGTMHRMKRLARFVLYALAPISFLLLSATVILWVRTYFASDRISFYARGIHWEIQSYRGEVIVDRADLKLISPMSPDGFKST